MPKSKKEKGHDKTEVVARKAKDAKAKEVEENRKGGKSLCNFIKAGEGIAVVGELINVSGRDLHDTVCLTCV
jgi:hypothetical protein